MGKFVFLKLKCSSTHENGKRSKLVGLQTRQGNPMRASDLSVIVRPLKREDHLRTKHDSVFSEWKMRNKLDAEKTEAQLLREFDYAWNKGCNGVRRPDDVLQKVERVSVSATPFRNIVRKLQTLNQKKVGIRIEAIGPFLPEYESGIYTDKNGYDFLARVFKFGRSWPRPVLDRNGINAENTSICGVALGGGSICQRPAIEGRKRCAEHKGMKIKGSISKLITEGKSHTGNVGLKSGVISEQEFCSHHGNNFNHNTSQQVAGKCTDSKDLASICGGVLGNGSPCKRQPADRRERFEDDKEMGINGSSSNSMTEGNSHHLNDVISESRCNNWDRDHVSFGSIKLIKQELGVICGVNLGEGFVCERQPVTGRQRCEEHKGMRVKAFPVDRDPVSIASNGLNNNNSTLHGTAVGDYSPSMCGATTSSGSFCRNTPIEGNKRCWLHRGKRAASSFTTFHADNPLREETYEHVRKELNVVCGVNLGEGFVCERQPDIGRKRCEEHKGMRVKAHAIDTSSIFRTYFEPKNNNRALYGAPVPTQLCGAMTVDGSFCRNRPVEGNKRCWQHKGRRADSSFPGFNTRGDSLVCGVPLWNGSICSRIPAHGRKRCEQHKGMRVT
ncbi:protein EFFECTOR OF TRANSCRIPTION-like isoform X2 [Malania oleifera]|uniref:protein EFFECTOR OF TRANSCRIPTION-like isoform X2 n=1 Tax=Malania oleifera TaxID=397392 RepID=UPI0025ADF3A3|nr:protein EFFECTOR OF TRANSCRIPTION-like isoform X2 [Malania oleifera]